MFSQTTDIGIGHGIDMLQGAYVYPVAPNGGPDWSFKFGVSWLLPR